MNDEMKVEDKVVHSKLPRRGTFGSMTLEELSGYASNAKNIQRKAILAASGDPMGHVMSEAEAKQQLAQMRSASVQDPLQALRSAPKGTKVFHQEKDKSYTLLGPVEGSETMFYVLSKEGKKVKAKGTSLVIVG